MESKTEQRMLTQQVRIVGFTFATEDAAALFAARCRNDGHRAFHQDLTVGVVTPTIDVEADVRIMAVACGAMPAGG